MAWSSEGRQCWRSGGQRLWSSQPGFLLLIAAKRTETIRFFLLFKRSYC